MAYRIDPIMDLVYARIDEIQRQINKIRQQEQAKKAKQGAPSTRNR